MPECLIGQVPSLRLPKCLSSQLPTCFKCPSTQVHFECPSASSALLHHLPNHPECRSTRASFECLKCPSDALSARVPECLECTSASVSQLVSQPVSHSAGLQCWFSKLISTLRAHTLREDIILRLKKLSTIV